MPSAASERPEAKVAAVGTEIGPDQSETSGARADRPSLAWQLGLAAAAARKALASTLGPAGAGIADDLRGAFAHILAARHLGTIILGGLAVAYILSGTYVVNPGEEAVVRRFGQIVDRRVGEGLRYRLPWPVEQADKVNVSQVRREGTHRREHNPDLGQGLESAHPVRVAGFSMFWVDLPPDVQDEIIARTEHSF